MGGKSSKSKGHVFDPDPYPNEPAYPGPSLQYHFVNCEVALEKHLQYNFLSTPIITSNVDAYYPLLAGKYTEGLKLLTFYRIPAQVHYEGRFVRLVQFQGIYSCCPTDPKSSGVCELRIEKSVLQPELVRTPFITTKIDVVTNTHHLSQTLARYSEMGARLICIEVTGQEQLASNFQLMKMPILGCDLFFEVPCGEITEKYIYNVDCIPISVAIAPGFPPKVVVNCDWMEPFTRYLNQGWKLVEIFYDKTSQSQLNNFSSSSQVNSQWYFEKPASRANDSTPVYEGTIVEHIIHSNMNGTKVEWEPIIQKMGNKGWELACILDTPEVRISIGLNPKIDIKTLLFFQRKILSNHSVGASSSFSAPPPSYPATDASSSPSAPPPSYPANDDTQ